VVTLFEMQIDVAYQVTSREISSRSEKGLQCYGGIKFFKKI